MVPADVDHSVREWIKSRGKHPSSQRLHSLNDCHAISVPCATLVAASGAPRPGQLPLHIHRRSHPHLLDHEPPDPRPLPSRKCDATSVADPPYPADSRRVLEDYPASVVVYHLDELNVGKAIRAQPTAPLMRMQTTHRSAWRRYSSHLEADPLKETDSDPD